MKYKSQHKSFLKLILILNYLLLTGCGGGGSGTLPAVVPDEKISPTADNFSPPISGIDINTNTNTNTII